MGCERSDENMTRRVTIVLTIHPNRRITWYKCNKPGLPDEWFVLQVDQNRQRL